MIDAKTRSRAGAQNATEGSAFGENLLVNGIMHKSLRAYFESGRYDDATPNAKRKIEAFVFAEALKPFSDPKTVGAGHAAKIAGLLASAQSEVASLEKNLIEAKAVVAEYKAMTKTQAAFCVVKHSYGGRDQCLRPVNHDGDHRTRN